MPELTTEQIADIVDRFREWSRTDVGAGTLFDVSDGQLAAENAMIAALVAAIAPSPSTNTQGEDR